MTKPQADSLTGPIYGVQLLDTLPLGSGCMLQQMPSRYDLQRVERVSQRTVAGLEVLTAHYRNVTEGIGRLEQLLKSGNLLKRQDDVWHVFSSDGKGIASGKTLLDLIVYLPKEAPK